MGGRLADRIVELRDEGLTWRQMAVKLHVENGLVVTDETLRRWFQQIAEEATASV